MPQAAQGGTIRLTALFRDSTNSLVDPVGPSLDILNPSDVVVVNDATPTRESQGSFFYDFAIPSNAPLGAWTARFSGTVDGGLVSGDEPFTVLAPGSVGIGVPWLVQLAEVKTALDIDPTDNRRDELLTAAITDASQAIINYTDRDFGSGNVTEERSFAYDGSGYLDIDDASALTAVKFAVPNATDITLTPDEWTPQPQRSSRLPVYYYLILPLSYPNLPSAELGFTYNYDRYVLEHGRPIMPQIVKVTGTWGWPNVPDDVKRATIWTISAWTENPGGSDNLQSESIEGFSRSWANALQAMGALAIPNRARDILSAYQREPI